MAAELRLVELAEELRRGDREVRLADDEGAGRQRFERLQDLAPAGGKGRPSVTVLAQQRVIY